MKTRYENGIVSAQALTARRTIAAEVRNSRKSAGMTQEMLADRSGTKKSNISRMESGNYNPSLDFLVKVAESLGKKVEIHIE